MPARDVRPTVSRYRGGGYGGGRSSQRYYDDEGRGESKDIWEWFKSYFEADPTLDHLLAIDELRCYQLIKNSTDRHGLMDIAFYWTPGWKAPDQDTRAHRLVLHYHLTEDNWKTFHEHLVKNYDAHKETIKKEEHERAERWDGEHAAYQSRMEAERIQRDEQDKLAIHEIVEITAGTLSSELNQVFISTDKVGNEGDWIEEMVDTYQDGSGFGYEADKATGIKLQITLSLDLSNSMYYNGVHREAAGAFRDLGMSLKALKSAYQDDLYVAFFTFSEDEWEGKGKRVVRLEIPQTTEDKTYFQPFTDYRPSVINGWYKEGVFGGTDTWMAPLFEKIEKWEKAASDPGAVKLDIVITDAVLEHKKDLKESDVIQERRDGSLQTVFLNFLSAEESINSSLPKRCYQVHVDKDNVAGTLRNVISEFVGAHL